MNRSAAVILMAALVSGLTGTGAGAQERSQPYPAVVISCGSASYTAGINSAATQETTGLLCSSAAATPQSGASYALTPIAPSSTVESSHVMCSVACNSYGFQVNTTTAQEWVMAFNLTAAPADGAVTPVRWWQVPANGTLIVDVTDGNIPIRFTTGWTLVCSTTGPFTKTASALCTFAGEKQ